jgi:hypothetical protein
LGQYVSVAALLSPVMIPAFTKLITLSLKNGAVLPLDWRLITTVIPLIKSQMELQSHIVFLEGNG